METFNLNLIPGKNNPVVHASQFDEGRVIRVNLFEGSSVYTLDGTEVISISVRKNDGHIVTEAITNTSDSYVEIVTTEQMTACAGSNLCELKIEKGSDVIGTLNFILEVEVDPLDGGDPSESFIHDLNAQIYAAVADQYDSNNVIFDNAPTPGHGVGYVVTSEGTPDELDDLSDVTYTGTPALGEAVVWDGSKWTNGTVSTVGSIDDLNDVDTTGKAEGDSLRYDSGSGEWVAKPIVIEVTQAEYNQLVLDGDLQPLTTYVITDAPNLNATAQNLSYDGGVTSTYDEVESLKAVETDTYNIATYGGYVKCIKQGKMVTVMCVDFGTTQAPATGSAYTLTTIASKYRPSVNMRVNGYANYSSYKYDGMQGYAVNSDGTIVTYNYGNPAITKGNFVLTFIKD